MSDEGKTVNEVMEEYNKFHNLPLNVTDSITHDEFVAGVASKTTGFTMAGGQPYTLIKGAKKAIFNTLCAMYQLVPLLVIPFWAYHEQNWWLLIGIPIASLIAPLLFRRSRKASVGGLVLLVFLISWISVGFHNYFTFFLLCAFWGLLFYQIADYVQGEYAMQSLVEDSKLFSETIADRRIFILRKR
jgi:hypothetical protein